MKQSLTILLLIILIKLAKTVISDFYILKEAFLVQNVVHRCSLKLLLKKLIILIIIIF